MDWIDQNFPDKLVPDRNNKSGMSQGCNKLLKETTQNNISDSIASNISLDYFLDVEHDHHSLVVIDK